MHRFKDVLKEHSLSIAAVFILALWIVLYLSADPSTHAGAFYGNAIADWSGSVVLIVGTKFLIERGSKESENRGDPYTGVKGFLYEHSLTLFLIVTGIAWTALYLHVDPQAKWGQVVGNVVSSWVQMLGLVFLTKRLYERGSGESK